MFTAPCDGVLVEIDMIHQKNPGAPLPTLDGTLFVYDGFGTGGTVLGSQAFSEPVVPPATALFGVLVLDDPIPVTMGIVYSFFADLDKGSTLLHAENPGPYPDGEMLVTFDGDPATAMGGFGIDMRVCRCV